MSELEHLFPEGTAEGWHYTRPSGGGGDTFDLPPRAPQLHGRRLVAELRDAEKQFRQELGENRTEPPPRGIVLDFCSDPQFELKLKSLDIQRSGIELRSSKTVDEVMHGVVFVPEGKLSLFAKRFEEYSKGPRGSKGGQAEEQSRPPANNLLVGSISAVHRALLRHFWTDREELFPDDEEQSIWWEVWLSEGQYSSDVTEVFRARARVASVEFSSREIRFPERRVLIARATVDQWLKFENLFDILAELRRAKTVPSDYLTLPTRVQQEFVEDVVAHIQPPPIDAPAVCHLDTGVNRGHPLIEIALSDEHWLTVDEGWGAADEPKGHGTAMAGLALFGQDLRHMLESNETYTLSHRLESVKLIRNATPHSPDLYGHVTSQAISRIDIAAPDRHARAICLTITTDEFDAQYPTSWSARIDQICAGVGETGQPDAPRRLIIVAAGNTPQDGREDYLEHNRRHGIEDPAQSWNAITVGAYTEKDKIYEPGYDGWDVIAPCKGLSPASCTSCGWVAKNWPLKPDIVMEGGNNAIDPFTGKADDVDDLALLTTALSYDGQQLTATGDTSAAAALAANYAARIWSVYPNLWPETIRGLLVHSARYTQTMLEQFPGTRSKDCEDRLRCCGYGVPDLSKAVHCVENRATMIVEETVQPFKREASQVKSNKMHLHELPWPPHTLLDRLDVDVRLRITLSYYIEPSPGRRGWKNRFQYQSHGLRFDVMRPLEKPAEFLKRINEAAREKGEKVDSGTVKRRWEFGAKLRDRGSVHRDTWTGTGAELAQCGGVIAVFPVGGWWKEHTGRKCWDREARYSLIVTLETDKQDVDLYTPIAQQIDAAAEAAVKAQATAIEIDALGGPD